jgi:hypothetical protein
MDNRYTLSGALEFKKHGKIEEWIHEFLLGVGHNKEFSDGLKLQDRFYLGPVKLPLKVLKRICGPEEHMKYQIPEEGFEYNVNSMIKAIKDGWDLPPLIVYYGDKEFELNDDNHRFEALVRSGISHYHVIFWTSSAKDFDELQVYENEQIYA